MKDDTVTRIEKRIFREFGDMERIDVSRVTEQTHKANVGVNVGKGDLGLRNNETEDFFRTARL